MALRPMCPAIGSCHVSLLCELGCTNWFLCRTAYTARIIESNQSVPRTTTQRHQYTVGYTGTPRRPRSLGRLACEQRWKDWPIMSVASGTAGVVKSTALCRCPHVLEERLPYIGVGEDAYRYPTLACTVYVHMFPLSRAGHPNDPITLPLFTIFTY